MSGGPFAIRSPVRISAVFGLIFLGLGLILAGRGQATSDTALARLARQSPWIGVSVTGEGGSRPVRDPGELMVRIETTRAGSSLAWSSNCNVHN